MAFCGYHFNGSVQEHYFRYACWRSLALIWGFGLMLSVALTPTISNGQDKGLQTFEFQLPSSDQHEQIRVPDFEVKNVKLTVVCFLGTECPLARMYGPRLMDLEREFRTSGVRFVGVMSNHQDSSEDIRRYIQETGITFQIAMDTLGQVADKFGAERTPEVFVFDEKLAVVYQGRIDDQYQPGVARKAPTKNDLRDALTELIAGEPVSTPRADAVGCRIGRIPKPSATAQVTYSEHVQAVLKRNCVECHRAGEIAPFALTDYDEIVGWGETMLEVIRDGRMPPWHASPDFGKFANARVMPETDKVILRDWIAAGMPLGDPAKVSASTVTETQSSALLSPDAVFAMRDRPFVVPESGTVEYQYFVVDPGFKTDQWVSAVEITPGNRSVVHHGIVFIRPPDGGRFRGVGWLGAYVPGQRNIAMPSGHARFVPAGSKLVFQMHYTPNGTKQEDLTRIAMQIVPESAVTHEVFTLAALDQEFEIPPGAANHPVHAKASSLPEHGRLLAIAPHMHYRGKSFRVEAVQIDRAEVLLDVPRYDFNWQHSYVLAEPLPLANIDSLRMTAKFDNSATNPFNPDPTQYVTWGDQTWEEMAVAFFEVSEPRNLNQQHRREPIVAQSSSAATVKSPSTKDQPGPTVVSLDDELNSRVSQFVDDFFVKLDIDGDGRLQPSEAPLAVKRFSFYQFDVDGNNIITRTEVEQVARGIIR